MSASTAPDPGDDPRVQMNVRLPQSIRDQIDARRDPLGISRDQWVQRALTWALRQPPHTPVHTAPGKRTARRNP